jgi:hypothetical protein
MPMKPTLALLTVLCGCSTTARVSLFDGRRFEARIQESDKENVVVETKAGWVVPIPRSEIADIDHPGNVTALVGLLLGAYGAVNVATVVGTCDKNPLPEVACASAFLPITVGVSMALWGTSIWSASTKAAGSPEPSGVVPSPPPPSALDFSPRGPLLRRESPSR